MSVHRRRDVPVAVVLLLLALLVADGSARAAEPTRPNVLLIVLDDATLRGADDMLPDSRGRIVGTVGVSYRRSFVAIPSCCPERSTLLTGRFPHNTGVRRQALGGTLDKTRTLPADLHRAGYRTYHVGKLLHEPVETDPPPGVFDRWLIGGSLATYVDPVLNLDGTVQQVPGYTTTITGDYARRFLSSAEATDDAQPWYLSLNFKAPHAPAKPEPRYATLPVPPLTFPDEADRSDKPAYLRNRDVTAAEAAALRTAMWRTLASVDDQVVQTLTWLARHGELADTLVLLTSDNGFHHGQNRWTSKFVPYTPALQVPLWLRGPGVPARGTDTSRMVSGVDVAATIYDATGAPPSSVLDGQSLLDPSPRTEVYAEYFNDPANGPGIPPWATVRGSRWQYVETYDTATGARTFREWYDLAADPHMLRNLLADGDPANDPATGAVAARLAAYRTCAGAGCPR